MQKISSYLYSNRISVNLNVASSPLEWRIVYQRTVKIYKGYDNTLEFDIKNNEQKRIDLSDFDQLDLHVMDVNNTPLPNSPYQLTASSTKGLATVSIPKTDLDDITPQFLKYALTASQEAQTNLMYADTQFNAMGSLELLGTINPVVDTARTYTNFTYLHDTQSDVITYYSDSIEVDPRNDLAILPTNFTVNFYNNGLAAQVKVEVTKDLTSHTATKWQTLEEFSIADSTVTLAKSYANNADYVWLRISYIRSTGNTGKFDKLVIIQ